MLTSGSRPSSQSFLYLSVLITRGAFMAGGGYFIYAGEDKGSEAAICVVVRKPLSMLRADLPVWLL